MSKGKGQGEGNILTFLRVRPSKKPSGYFVGDDLDVNTLVFNKPTHLKSDIINNSKARHEFHFNGILSMDAGQEDVFKLVGAAAVQNALDGFNSTIFAYGQTGSGKTFTITGGSERYVDRGIIPRSISMIFNEFRGKSDIQLKAYVSYLELYNETGYDLLDPSHETKTLEEMPKVTMLEDEHGNFHFKNLSLHAASSEEEALELLFAGDTNRAIAETPMNMASSRSHCIFTISLEVHQLGADIVRRSKLNLVDLAGSERVAKTNSSGSVLTEAMYINSSLFYLEMVIKALHEKATKGRNHIPYRNSMMTSVLRDSLGGNCKTIMVATINPEAGQTEESLSTCRFAQRVSLIKNKATINENLDPDAVIRRLKSEILMLREEVSFMKGEAGDGDVLTPQAQDDLKRKCSEYCDDPDPLSVLNIGSMSLTRIKDAFAIFKNLVLGARGAGGTSSASAATAGDPDMLRQVEDLRSCLLQRDTEIAILVNMVKKGKNSAPSGANVSEAGPAEFYGNDEYSESGSQPQSQPVSGGNSRARQGDAGGAKEDMPARSVKATAKAQSVLKEDRENRIVKRHLFNVPPPDDRRMFDDMSACFEYFRDRSELRFAIEENKQILKEKMTQAQVLGEKANQSRNTINYLKNSIEAIRRERALQGIARSDEESGRDENDQEQHGQESPEEQAHRRAIEQEKTVYRDSFEKIRVLKPEIEYLRKMLEKGRASMQNQFDSWYNQLQARGGSVAVAAPTFSAPPKEAFGDDRTAEDDRAMVSD
jgi:kinesin family protein 6/9